MHGQQGYFALLIAWLCEQSTQEVLPSDQQQENSLCYVQSNKRSTQEGSNPFVCYAQGTSAKQSRSYFPRTYPTYGQQMELLHLLAFF